MLLNGVDTTPALNTQEAKAWGRHCRSPTSHPKAFPAFSGFCLPSDFSTFQKYVKGGPTQLGLPPDLTCCGFSRQFSAGTMCCPGDTWQCPEIFLIVTTRGGRGGATGI